MPPLKMPVCLLWGHCSFLLGPGVHKVLLCLLRVCFSSSVIKSHWPSKSDFLGVLSPFAGSTGWEICLGPRTFATVQELLWYNCSPVCGLPVQWLYSGPNGDFLKRTGVTHIILLTKVYIVKAVVFLVVIYGCESWTLKKAEHP